MSAHVLLPSAFPMAKALNSVVGVDIGRYSLKAVLLQRRKDRLAVTHYGSYIPEEFARDADELGRQLKALFKDMGGAAKNCVVSVSSPDALIRIIEQPETPTYILRDALRLNGMALLNQDVKSLVIDCDRIPAANPRPLEPGMVARHKYLVGGVPRDEVEKVSAAVTATAGNVHALQLSPVGVYNAFEVARPDVFNDGAFFIVDIGHINSTMLVGMRKELILVRQIDFGGGSLMDSLCGLSGDHREAVISALDHEDEVMIEYTRVNMNTLTREISSSIGFIEHHHEAAIGRVFVTGGPARSRVFLKLMGEELGIPCEAWSAVAQCDVEISGNRRAEFEREALDLNVACGVAAPFLSAN